MQSAINFKSDGVDLEGILALPDHTSHKVAGVVVCHPHPLMGGNMDNPVVMWICRTLMARGLATLRFNFRGVWNSRGVHTKGEKETTDVKAALDLLGNLPGIDKRKMGLAGYSFGSGMILSAFPKFRQCEAFCLISPPPRYYQASAISNDKRPRMIISGDHDKSVSAADLKAFVNSMPLPADLRLVQGADHSWGRYVEDMANQVGDFFTSNLA